MKIGIVSPSAPSTQTKQRKKQFNLGLKTLKSLGFDYQLSSHTKNFLHYLSDTPQNRLKDLHLMYKDKNIDLIMAANGGWNSNQLLSRLNFNLIKKNPKPLVGFSDITILLNAIFAKTGLIQIHGPMVTWGFDENNELTNQSFLDVLIKKRQIFSLPAFGNFLKKGPLRGVLVGGNLTSLETLIGTPYEPDWQRKIFFWEVTEKTIWNLDRVLTHFKNAGVWEKIKGMIIGNLNKINNKFCAKKIDVLKMIKNHFADYNFPILKTDLFGHNTPSNISIPVGGKIEIKNKKVVFYNHVS